MLFGLQKLVVTSMFKIFLEFQINQHLRGFWRKMGSYPNIQHRSSAHWAINRRFSYLPLRLTNNNKRGVWKSHSMEKKV